MSRRARWEVLTAVYPRYRGAARVERGRILDEFCETTGYQRKYALRLLNGPPPGPERPRRRRRPATYGLAVIQALTAIWEAAGYPWSVRLKALLPLWLPWARRRLRLSATVCQQLRAISPRQIDRRLAATKRQLTTRRYGRTKPGTLLKHHIPLKTDHWDVTVSGFTELDLVAHAGHRADGEFAHSLNVTDIHTTWVETRAVLGRGEARVQTALEEIRQVAALPPPRDRLRQRVGVHQQSPLSVLPGPGDPVHARATVQEGRQRPHRAEELDPRPQARGVLAVRHAGRRGRAERSLSARAPALPQPLPAVGQAAGKERVGARLRRRYDAPRTPLDRVAGCPEADPQAVAALVRLRDQFDPFALAQAIDRKIERLVALATPARGAGVPTPTAASCPPIVPAPTDAAPGTSARRPGLHLWQPPTPAPGSASEGYMLDGSTIHPSVSFLDGLTGGPHPICIRL